MGTTTKAQKSAAKNYGNKPLLDLATNVDE